MSTIAVGGTRLPAELFAGVWYEIVQRLYYINRCLFLRLPYWYLERGKTHESARVGRTEVFGIKRKDKGHECADSEYSWGSYVL